jgi:glycosyltransferase involved in cell wall biosynthesis
MGGAETMLVQLAVHLQFRGYQQHVVSLTGRGDLAVVLEERGVSVTALNANSLVSGLSGVLQLRRIVERTLPNVIQSWMYHGNLAATLAHLSAAQRGRRRLYWGIRASDMDFARYGRVIAWNARLSSIPELIIANSKAGATFHIAHGFHAERIRVVANGIDTEKFRPDLATRAALRSELGFRPDDVVIIHVARVDPMKDHATFLEAMKMLPHFRAVLVGAGTKQLSLPQNVRALGARSDVERLYSVGDIVASSSAFGEGFSNAIAEGMSAGLVPVATNVGDAAFIVGDIGGIVPAGDPAALTTALSKFASLSPDVRHSLGKRARGHILQHFAISRAVEDFEKLYVGP